MPVGCDNTCVIFSWLAVLEAFASCWKLSSREFTFQLVAVASGKGKRKGKGEQKRKGEGQVKGKSKQFAFSVACCAATVCLLGL